MRLLKLNLLIFALFTSCLTNGADIVDVDIIEEVEPKEADPGWDMIDEEGFPVNLSWRPTSSGQTAQHWRDLPPVFLWPDEEGFIAWEHTPTSQI